MGARRTTLYLGYITNMIFFGETAGGLVFTNRGIRGPPWYHDCVQSFRVLGRIVERTGNGITWKADPRHAEFIRKSYGVTSRSVSTPGIRDEADDIDGEVPIGKEVADRYRANTMRAQYLSSDRPVTLFTNLTGPSRSTTCSFFWRGSEQQWSAMIRCTC